MAVPVSLGQALRSLLKCKQVPGADLAARLIEYLIEHPEGATIGELSEGLSISFPMALRAVNELESLNVVETSKVKREGGRGRAKKLVKLYKPMLLQLVKECREILGTIEEVA